MSALVAATRYEWLLLFHILGAMVWLGGLVTLTVLSTLVVRSRDETVVARFVSSLRVLGPLTLQSRRRGSVEPDMPTPINLRLRGEPAPPRVRAPLRPLAAEYSGTAPPEPSGPTPETRVGGPRIAPDDTLVGDPRAGAWAL